MTKIAAIYNIADGEEFFSRSIEQIKDHVDVIIVIYSTVSNYGQPCNPPFTKWQFPIINRARLIMMPYWPDVNIGGARNERMKRNLGLDIAKAENCTHFLHMDCDEFYEDFGTAKKAYFQAQDEGSDGSVCRLYTYFRLPTLRFELPDSYYVPFIHKLYPNTIAGGVHYPFYVDPTRKVGTHELKVYRAVILPHIYMHHFSYVRRNIHWKLDNSSAKVNIEMIRDQIMEDYNNAKPGYCCKSYDNMKLIEVPNQFNIQI